MCSYDRFLELYSKMLHFSNLISVEVFFGYMEFDALAFSPPLLLFPLYKNLVFALNLWHLLVFICLLQEDLHGK